MCRPRGALVLAIVLVGIVFASAGTKRTIEGSAPIPGFRPPAIPLVNLDPYLSIWQMSDNLTDVFTRYWDNTVKALVGLMRIDGTPYRFMGPMGQSGGLLPPPMQQISVVVWPTQTYFTFQQDGVQLDVTFTSPLLPTDIDMLTRPVTYITFDVSSIDGKSHYVQLYYDNTAEIAVNFVTEYVEWQRHTVAFNSKKGTKADSLVVLQMGTSAQKIFGTSGDTVGIDWGYVYAATAQQSGLASVMSGALETRNSFSLHGYLPSKDDTNMPRACEDDWPVLAFSWNFSVSGSQSQERVLMLGYDEIYSIEWFGVPLRPYWNQNNSTSALTMMASAAEEYETAKSACDSFDSTLFDALARASGLKYATLTSLAYRQAFGGCCMVWNHVVNAPWYFMKEISSDGDLSTVDVIFPASPIFLYFNPELLKLLLQPILAYANNETSVKYGYPWAPHHLGYYPIANIRPDQQENMPIEETGNMMLMIAGIVQRQNNDTQWLFPKYQSLLDMWGDYLVSSLPDPGDQLCTDDFEGPSPHNANLAAKGIVALDAYALLLDMAGQHSHAQKYRTVAANYTMAWQKFAFTSSGGMPHYKLEYDIDNSWSLKYNIVYQKFLGLRTFPDEIESTEVAWYDAQFHTYGIPLDDRSTFTKLDWESWVALMSNDTKHFTTLTDAMYGFAHNTADRVPLSDWYWTDNAAQRGFQARPVVGALFAKLLLSN